MIHSFHKRVQHDILVMIDCFAVTGLSVGTVLDHNSLTDVNTTVLLIYSLMHYCIVK